MYCRPQGYPSPHLIVPIRYHSTVPNGEILCHLVNWTNVALKHPKAGLCWIRSTPNPQWFSSPTLITVVYTLSPRKMVMSYIMLQFIPTEILI